MAGYTPNANSVIHSVKASLDRRGVPNIVHLVQYDRAMPILAVELTYGDQPFAVPATAEVNIRLRKPDGTHVYDPALGTSEDRRTVYIGVTAQMTTAAGRVTATLEILEGGGVVGTAPILFDVDVNPVPEDAIESTDEFLTVQDLAAQVAASAASAKASETEADKARSDAAGSAGEAAESAAEALRQAEAAQGAAEAAGERARNAAQSAETAKQYSGNPPEIDEDGFWNTWDADAQKYTSTGEKAVNHWDTTYRTVAEMQADKSQPKNTVCIISSDVEQEENAQVYMWDGAKWNFLCDLSGLQGVGVAKIELTGGDHTPGTDDTYTITLTDRREYTFTVHNGSESVTSVNGETGAVTVKKIVSSVGGTYAGSQVTLNGDQKNEYLKIEAIKGSDLMDRVDIVVDKTDGHPWLHLWKGTSQASGDIGNQTVYTSAFPQPSVSGNAGTATKLSTPRSLKTNLGSTTVVTFDGSAAQDNIPVTGTLPIGNGGTGKTTAPEALTALGGVPTTRTVNGKALSTNITLSAADVNAVPVTGGTFTGSVYVDKNGESDVGVAFSGGMLYLFGMKSSAKRGLYDNKKNKFVIEIDDNITAHFLGTADQLEGHPASHFLRTDVTAPPSDDTPQNWQSIGACILYVPPAQAVSIGLPSTYGILMSMIPVVHQSDFVQVFFEMFNEGRMWTRCGSGGKWARNWTQV